MQISNEFYESVLIDLAACDEGDFNISTLAFSVADKIVECNDVDFLRKIPQRLLDEILGIAKSYQVSHRFFVHSSVGSFDHSDLASRFYLMCKKGGYL